MMIAVLIIAVAATLVVVIGGYKYAYAYEIERAEHAEQLEAYCEGLYYEGPTRMAGGDVDEQS